MPITKDAGLPPHRAVVITALGIGQILAWGTSFYFPAVFAGPIVADTGWSLGIVVGGTSIGLLVAGLISPQVGHLIGGHGGRPVLLASSLFYAAGLVGIGLAPALPIYLLSWVVLGLGMGTGLYDAVFAALGRLYGHEARGPITNLTLFGGFSSTVCWPLSAFMIEHIGWRDACLVYAALHLVLALPLQMAVIGRASKAAASSTESIDAAQPQQPARIANETTIFALLALVLSIAAGVGSIVVVHLMIFLQARGVDYTSAVGLGTLFGPAQVAARVAERLSGAHYHPIWTMIAACALMATGLMMLLGHFPAAGAGNPGLRRGLRRILDRSRHAAARSVRAAAVSAADGQARISQPDRAGSGAVGWRAADRVERDRYDHRRIDGAGADQCRAGRHIVGGVPAADLHAGV